MFSFFRKKAPQGPSVAVDEKADIATVAQLNKNGDEKIRPVSADEEKQAIDVDKVLDGAAQGITWTEAEEKAILRKIDLRVPIILGVLYAAALIDQTNLSLAVIAGAGETLKLLGPGNRSHYKIALFSFFITYILCEVPAQILHKKVGPKYWLSSLALAWGLVIMLQAFVKDYGQLSVTRMLCGAFEAGYFPGAVWLMSGWYTRKDIVMRMAEFWMVSVMISAFGGILGWGFVQMKGLGGKAGYQWMWIMEGSLTMVLAIAAFFIIDGFPTHAKWLTDRERQIILRRLEIDRGDARPDPLSWKQALEHCKDFKLWGIALLFLCTLMAAYSFAFYAGIVMQSCGYNTNQTLLLNIPLQVLAGLYTVLMAYMSYKFTTRAPCIAISSLTSIVGLGMMLTYNNRVRLAGTFLGAAGCAADITLMLAYQASNVVGWSKKNLSVAIMISFGGIGGMMTSLVFDDKQRPYYHTGLWVAMSLEFLLLTILAAMTLVFHLHNQQQRAGKRVIEGRPDYTYIL